MSDKFTPGPWWVAEQGEYRVASIAPATNIYADLMPTQGRIAADACLIAAAPDLLEALIEINQHAAGFKTTGMATESFLAWDAKARAAIAKATEEAADNWPAENKRDATDLALATANMDLDECEANARLIAVAPELLEACKLFVAYDNNDATDGVAMMVAYNNAVIAARAAIAKATAHSIKHLPADDTEGGAA